MPEITSVESQKKQKNRFNIYIDGKFAFGADENVVAKFRIHAGLKLSATQVTNLVKESDQAKLMDQTLNFLSYRPRSEKEIRDYLTKRISKKMLSELVTSIKNIKGWGTVEIIIQDHLVTQITEKNIRKPLLSERSSKSL